MVLRERKRLADQAHPVQEYTAHKRRRTSNMPEDKQPEERQSLNDWEDADLDKVIRDAIRHKMKHEVKSLNDRVSELEGEVAAKQEQQHAYQEDLRVCQEALKKSQSQVHELQQECEDKTKASTNLTNDKDNMIKQRENEILCLRSEWQKKVQGTNETLSQHAQSTSKREP